MELIKKCWKKSYQDHYYLRWSLDIKIQFNKIYINQNILIIANEINKFVSILYLDLHKKFITI